MLENYSILFFPWTEDFAHYRNTRAMEPVVAKLKAGMDEVSCDYVDRFTILHDVARLGNDGLVKLDFLLSPTDKFLLECNKQMVAAGQPAILRQLDFELSTVFTNSYGLYDMPEEVMKAVDGKAVFDVGGYIGDTLMLFQALFPQSLMLSFEPDDQYYQQLIKSMHAGIESGKILAFPQGLSDKKGKLLMEPDNHEGVMATFVESAKDDRAVEVEVTTIDEVVKERQLDVGMIKVDIEGYEMQVVQGALETIKSQRPMLVIAIYHQPEEFYELKPFLESLNLGYKFRLRRSNFYHLLCELVLIAYVDD